MAFAGKNVGPATPASSPASDSLIARTQALRERFSREELMQVDQAAAKVLKGLLRSKSFFREKDLARRILERCQKDFSQELVERDKFSKLIENVVENMPFITIADTGYVTVQEVADREKLLLSLAGYQTDEHVLNKTLVDMAIRAKRGISDEQIKAVEAACLSNRRVTVIEGTAGAGKSFTMQAIKEAYRQSGYDVVGTAVGWSPAQVLEASTGLDNCVALQGLVMNMQRARSAGTEYFRKPTLLIVDEAGMVGTAHMRAVLEETHSSKMPVKVVLTGDSLQLPPVDAGNALEAIVEFHGTTRIDTIRRQQKLSHRNAVKLFSQRRAGQALYTFIQQEAIRWCEDENSRFDMIVRDYLSYKQAFPHKKALILALENREVVEINKRVRKVYKKLGLVKGREVELTVTDGRTSWDTSFAVGDEVVVRANSKELQVYKIPSDGGLKDVTRYEPTRIGVYNRNTGKIVGIVRSKDPVGSFDLHIDLAGEKPGRTVLNSQTFKAQEGFGFPVVHNFATTIYASQGQTVNKVFFLDHHRMNFRLAYVGLSRHTDSVDVYLNETELHQRMDKMRGVAAPLAVKLAERDGTAPDVLPVTRGRYRRSEMLQTVALHWAKDAVNLTVAMLDREARLGRGPKAIVPPDEELARIAPASSEDPVTDFDPLVEVLTPGDTLTSVAERQEVDAEALDDWKANVRRWNGLAADAENLEGLGRLFLGERTNVTVPLIDVEALLNLPEPIEETTLVKPSVVESNNQSQSWAEIPLVNPASLKPSEPDPFDDETSSLNEDGGFLTKAWRLLSGKNAQAAPVQKPTRAASSPDSASTAPAVKTTSASAPPDAGWVESVISSVASALNPVASKLDVPMLPPTPSMGHLDDMGILRFATETQGVSEAMINATREVWWGVGREHQPRVFARDTTGQIVARYALDGQCVVGEGYPPMLINTRGGAQAPIMIVPGAKEWLWAHEHNQTRAASVDPKSIPHIVWGAKDVEWRWVAAAMRSKNVTIARSKTDEAQIPWAVDLQKELWENWGITANIRPRAPGLTAPWEVAAAPSSVTPASAPIDVPPVSPTPAPSPAVNVTAAPRPSVFKRR